MRMMLNKGIHENEDGIKIRVFKEETVELFTTRVEGLPYDNTRALGWDTVPHDMPCPCG